MVLHSGRERTEAEHRGLLEVANLRELARPLIRKPCHRDVIHELAVWKSHAVFESAFLTKTKAVIQAEGVGVGLSDQQFDLPDVVLLSGPGLQVLDERRSDAAPGMSRVNDDGETNHVPERRKWHTLNERMTNDALFVHRDNVRAIHPEMPDLCDEGLER